ncbi:hypothetical protein [Streptomyces sp. URMC 124]|uniref:hypothetical protein n=1 Tax=Streptomyces sp. URMC 124 TaxID=3423405 RepID=UPI003F19349F
MATRTATPDNEPFDFNLDAVEAEVDLTPWRVHWAGKRWMFAHMQSLDVWTLVEAAEGGDITAMTGIFRAALGDQAWAEFRKIKLPQYKMKALFDGYRRHCGLEPGESEASAS